MFRNDKNILLTCGALIAFTTTLFMFGFFQESYAVRGPETKLLAEEKFSFKPRDEKKKASRKEGILRRKPVSGGVELISATIDYRDKIRVKDADSCYVGFFLEDTSKVKITVQKPGKLYMMTPDKIMFPSGFSSFGWPQGAVLEPLNIDLHSLYAIAEIQNSLPLRIAPVVLFDSIPPADTIKGYRFIFRTETPSDFKYRILRPASSGYETLYAGELVDQPPGEVLITWDGKDADGQLVEDGPCRLKIAITSHSRYKKGRVLAFTRDFYHNCVIPRSR